MPTNVPSAMRDPPVGDVVRVGSDILGSSPPLRMRPGAGRLYGLGPSQAAWRPELQVGLDGRGSGDLPRRVRLQENHTRVRSAAMGDLGTRTILYLVSRHFRAPLDFLADLVLRIDRGERGRRTSISEEYANCIPSNDDSPNVAPSATTVPGSCGTKARPRWRPGLDSSTSAWEAWASSRTCRLPTGRDVCIRLEAPRKTGWVLARVARSDGAKEGGLSFSRYLSS